jgi:hypothetical protein
MNKSRYFIVTFLVLSLFFFFAASCAFCDPCKSGKGTCTCTSGTKSASKGDGSCKSGKTCTCKGDGSCKSGKTCTCKGDGSSKSGKTCTCKGDGSSKSGKTCACKTTASKSGKTCTCIMQGSDYFITGRPHLDGPNLAVECKDGCKKTVVITGNTVIYPKDFNINKCDAFVYVKFTIKQGMSQALEVACSKYSSLVKVYNYTDKKYEYQIQHKK